MKYLQGTIGYTILKNNINNKKIIIFADMHDNLPPCPYSNSEKIVKWLEKKIYIAKILLEEINITENSVIEELWGHSKHTKELQEFYRKNKNIVEIIDIRPDILPFSWELSEKSDDKNMIFDKYIKNLLYFFKLKNTFFQDKLLIYNYKNLHNKLGHHLFEIFIIFKEFIEKYKLFLNYSIIDLYKYNSHILENYNIIINDCMEWYTCALIKKYKNRTIIVHAGLYHTEKIIKLLLTKYDYSKIYEIGMNSIYDKEKYICQPEPNI